MLKTKKPKLNIGKRRFSGARTLVVLAVISLGVLAIPLTHADTDGDYGVPTVNSIKPATASSVTATWTPGAKLVTNAVGTPNSWHVRLTNSTYDFEAYITSYSTHSYTFNSVPACADYQFLVHADQYNASTQTVTHQESGDEIPTATVHMPCTPKITGFGVSSDKGTVNWSGDSSATGYTVNINSTDSGFTGSVPAGSSTITTGAVLTCGVTYTATVTENVSFGSLKSSSVQASQSCPAPTGGSGSSSGGGSGSGSSGSGTSNPGGTTVGTGGGGGGGGGTTVGTTSAAGIVSNGLPQPPAAPTSFTATIQADKVVELSWNPSIATAGIQDYVINRSTDNVNWTPLTTTTDTTYEDDATSFSTTYYYQLEAVDNSGNVSDYSATQVTTGDFSGSSNKVTSDDKVVTAVIPDDAFPEQADCSIGSSDSKTSSGASGKQVLLVGPYSLLCVGQDGSILNSFDKPIAVTLNLAQSAPGFSDFVVKTIDGSSATTVKSAYNLKTQQISFSLTANKSFAAYGVRHKSSGGAIVSIFLILLLVAALIGGFIFMRRRMRGSNYGGYDVAPLPAATPVAMTDSALPMVPSASQQFEDAVNRPDCTHLNMAQNVQPQSTDCQECVAAGRQWKALRICLTCGHVGCSDDSLGQDARKHFEQTGHPLIMAYGDPAAGNIGWCYIDQTYI